MHKLFIFFPDKFYLIMKLELKYTQDRYRVMYSEQ